MKLKITLSIFGGALFGAGGYAFYYYASMWVSLTPDGKEIYHSLFREVVIYNSIPLLIAGMIIILIALFINRSSSGKASPSVQNNKPGVPGKE